MIKQNSISTPESEMIRQKSIWHFDKWIRLLVYLWFTYSKLIRSEKDCQCVSLAKLLISYKASHSKMFSFVLWELQTTTFGANNALLIKEKTIKNRNSKFYSVFHLLFKQIITILWITFAFFSTTHDLAATFDRRTTTNRIRSSYIFNSCKHFKLNLLRNYCSYGFIQFRQLKDMYDLQIFKHCRYILQIHSPSIQYSTINCCFIFHLLFLFSFSDNSFLTYIEKWQTFIWFLNFKQKKRKMDCWIPLPRTFNVKTRTEFYSILNER